MSALASHMAGATTTVCRAWTLLRGDGVAMGFTDHDRDLTVAGVRCLASSGMTAGALQMSTGLSVDNVEATGALSHAAITEEDLRAGRWDAAEVTAWLVNWADAGQAEVLFRGTFGEIAWADGAFSVEMRGLAEALNRVRGRVYQARCDAVLGDGRCGRDLDDTRFAVEAEVAAVEGDRVLTLEGLSGYAPRWFERGRVDVLDGPAAGLFEQVKTDRLAGGGRQLELWAQMRAPLAAGVRVRLTAGCDKRMETCRQKFDNLLNFRGFPHLPGEDWLMAYPTGRSINDGGRR